MDRRDFLRRTMAVTAGVAIGRAIPERVDAAEPQPIVEVTGYEASLPDPPKVAVMSAQSANAIATGSYHSMYFFSGKEGEVTAISPSNPPVTDGPWVLPYEETSSMGRGDGFKWTNVHRVADEHNITSRDVMELFTPEEVDRIVSGWDDYYLGRERIPIDMDSPYQQYRLGAFRRIK